MLLTLPLVLALGAPQAQPPKVTPRLGDAPNRQLDELRRDANPATNAMVVAMLRRYVDGTRSPNAIDTAVKKRMDALPGGKAAAKRILARLDAMPTGRKGEAFGGRATTGAVTVAQWSDALAQGAGLIHGGIGTTPPDVLPAEAQPVPTEYAVTFGGASTTAATDADGSDELVVMSSFIRVHAGAYLTTTHGVPEVGAIEGLVAGAAVPQSTKVYQVASNAPAALAVTAAFEADGDTTTMREDYLAMLALAEPLAIQAEGETSLDDYVFALDYTMGLLHLSDAAHWPNGTLTRSVLSQDTSLQSLWATPSQTTGGIEWKLRHDHSIGAAKYSVFFDVPGPAVVMPAVTVKIVNVVSIDGVDGSDADDLNVRVAIGDEDKTKKLAENDDDPNISWGVQRKIELEPRTITVEVWDYSPAPEAGSTGGWFPSLCGNWAGKLFPPCQPVITPLVIKGSATKLILQYDPVTKKITGDATSKVGDFITVAGSSGKRVQVKLKITQTN